MFYIEYHNKLLLKKWLAALAGIALRWLNLQYVHMDDK